MVIRETLQEFISHSWQVHYARAHKHRLMYVQVSSIPWLSAYYEVL